MSATSPVAVEAWFPTNASNREWAQLSAQAPQLVASMRRYLLQLTTFLAPRSVEAADTTLRQLARWLTSSTEVTVVAGIERRHIEDYKVWLAAQAGRAAGLTLAKNTQRQRLRMIRIFLERLIEWGLARRARPQPDPARRHPTPHRTDPQVPHRPTSRRVHGRGPRPPCRPLPARRPSPGPHRSACQ